MEQFKILLINAMPLLLQGLKSTLQLWVIALLFSLFIGVLLGIFRSNVLRIPYISSLLDNITFIFRGIPFYVQLLIAYYVVPHVLGLNISPFNAATLSLGLCSASYVSQIVRGGINAISLGQWEAAHVLGCNTFVTVWYIIMPQMIKIVLPALIGECDQLLKSTAIVSTIGVLELTGAGKNIVAQEMNPLTIYTLLAVIYLFLSALLASFSVWIENKMRYNV